MLILHHQKEERQVGNQLINSVCFENCPFVGANYPEINSSHLSLWRSGGRRTHASENLINLRGPTEEGRVTLSFWRGVKICSVFHRAVSLIHQHKRRHKGRGIWHTQKTAAAFLVRDIFYHLFFPGQGKVVWRSLCRPISLSGNLSINQPVHIYVFIFNFSD